MSTDSNLLKLVEVMRILHVSRSTVYRLMRHHGLPVRHISTRIRRVDTDELDLWLRTRRRSQYYAGWDRMTQEQKCHYTGGVTPLSGMSHSQSTGAELDALLTPQTGGRR